MENIALNDCNKPHGNLCEDYPVKPQIKPGVFLPNLLTFNFCQPDFIFVVCLYTKLQLVFSPPSF